MTVSNCLKNLSDRAIIRDHEKKSIHDSIDTIKHRLDKHFEDDIEDQFIFGSYTRDTILPRSMDTHSDVDYMVVFNDDGITPQSYLNRLKKFVENQYWSSEAHQSHPTIKLDLERITFELVPALKSRSGYKIPNRNHGGDGWIDTDPNDFNKDLIEKNKEHGSLIKPVIRLMKYWNAQNVYICDSFELEKWIIKRNFSGLTLSLKEYFFHCIEELVTEGLIKGYLDVDREKTIIAEVKELEADGRFAEAEDKIEKLFKSRSLSARLSGLSNKELFNKPTRSLAAVLGLDHEEIWI
ncbi:MAG: hypothetical protein P0S93_03580 [Candidatus Neptunochlamydia sp.]|nr:hypothetical protein [Candidatus Neptunochlamydia sp.]